MFSSFSFLSPNIVTNGLILHLDFTDKTSYAGSGTTTTNLAETFITGSLLNGPVYDSANGGNITLDGVNDYIDVQNSNALNITGSITIDVWFKPNAAVSSSRIVGKGGQTNQTYGLWYSTVQFNTFTRFERQGFASNVNGVPNVGSWNNIVVTDDGSSNNNFVNGTHYGGGSTAPTSSASTASFTIGYGTPNFTSSFYHNGGVAIVRIYNRALSRSEIDQNYNATRQRFGLGV